MTTPKCPLCGETPEYILDEGDGHCEFRTPPREDRLLGLYEIYNPQLTLF